MYKLYFCGVNITELPTSFSVKVGGKNKTLDLLDGRTISFLRSPGIKEGTLSLSFPLFGSKRNASYYTSRFQKFFKNKKPTQLILTQTTPDGKPIDDTNIKCAIWDYTESETADEFNEKTVTISWKEYVEYGTQTFTVKTVTVNGKTQRVATVQTERETTNAPQTTTYKVQEGDTLWKIAAKYLGTSSRYKELFESNNLSNPCLVETGITLKVPTK